MADQKVTDLTALTSASGDETIYVVEDPAGTPVNRKLTVENLMASMGVGVTLVWDGADFEPAAHKASDRHKTFIGPDTTDPDGHSGVVLNENDLWKRWPTA